MTREQMQNIRLHLQHHWTCNALKRCWETVDHDDVPCEHKPCDCGADKALKDFEQLEAQLFPPPVKEPPAPEEKPSPFGAPNLELLKKLLSEELNPVLQRFVGHQMTKPTLRHIQALVHQRVQELVALDSPYVPLMDHFVFKVIEMAPTQIGIALVPLTPEAKKQMTQVMKGEAL